MTNNDQEDYIPELDMNEWFHGDEPTKTKFVQKYNKGFCTSGFVTVYNHGVPISVIDDFYHSTKNFFDLSLEEKLKYKSVEWLEPGYHPRGEENFEAIKTDEEKQNSYDHNETYQVAAPTGVPRPTDDQIPSILFQPYKNYWTHLNKLTYVLHEIADRALGLPPGTMSKWHTQHHGDFYVHLRLADYYALSPDEVSERIKRIGAHTDYMTFTILKCDAVPGLEVAFGEADFDEKNLAPRFEKWVPVKPMKDALVINVGDMMRFWTNGYWKSSFHRVVARPERRISMVYFTGPGLASRTDERLPCEECSGPDKFPNLKMSLSDYFVLRSQIAKK